MESGENPMNQRDLVLKVLKENNGLITAGQVKEKGVAYKTLQRMSQSGEIEKIERGLYMDPNFIEDEFFLTQYRCQKGIFSHEAALYFHDLSDRTPYQLMLTIPSGFNTRLLKDKEHYRFFYVAEALHSMGVIEMVTPYGNKVKVYDRERTICDCLRKRNILDSDLVLEAVKKYLKGPEADYAKLLKYAEIFNVRDAVQKYMEVLM